MGFALALERHKIKQKIGMGLMQILIFPLKLFFMSRKNVKIGVPNIIFAVFRIFFEENALPCKPNCEGIFEVFAQTL